MRYYSGRQRAHFPLAPRTWRVVTTTGTVDVEATDAANAILAGLELTGPGATLVRCLRQGDW